MDPAQNIKPWPSEHPRIERLGDGRPTGKAETSVKFALVIMRVGAEGLDMMRIKDPNICSINQSADEVSAMSA